MRRTDREVKDINEILAIMDGCDALTLALNDGDYPYAIEMNFGYTYENEKPVIYLHAAKEGKKLELIKNDPHCAFSMSCKHETIPGKVECSTTFRYESVCGQGIISVITGEEAVKGLTVVSKKYLPDMPNEFSSKHTAAVTVLKIEVERFTGKRRFAK